MQNKDFHHLKHNFILKNIELKHIFRSFMGQFLLEMNYNNLFHHIKILQHPYNK